MKSRGVIAARATERSIATTVPMELALRRYAPDAGVKNIITPDNAWFIPAIRVRYLAGTIIGVEEIMALLWKIDAIYTAYDNMRIGTQQTYKESGRKDINFSLGGGCLKDITKGIIELGICCPGRCDLFSLSHHRIHLLFIHWRGR